MARNRMIRAEFWEDDKIAALTPYARLFFIALWNFADDEGYLQYRPQWLKAKCFPYDPVDIPMLIGELSGSRRVLIADGIIKVANFKKYQKVEKAKKSELSDKFEEAIKRIGEHSPNIPPPVPDSSPQEVKRSEEKLREEKILTPEKQEATPEPETRDINSLLKKALTPTATARTFTPKELSAMFAQIWAKYPRKEGMKGAFKHFTASVKNEIDSQDIQTALANYRAYLKQENKEPQFIKMGSTWFNNWRDWIVPPIPTKTQDKEWTPPPMSDAEKAESERLNAELMAGLAEPPIVDDLSNAL